MRYCVIIRRQPSAPFSGLCSDVQDRKSTRLNSSHSQISYAVFCSKKKIKFAQEIGADTIEHAISTILPISAAQHLRPQIWHSDPTTLAASAFVPEAYVLPQSHPKS